MHSNERKQIPVAAQPNDGSQLRDQVDMQSSQSGFQREPNSTAPRWLNRLALECKQSQSLPMNQNKMFLCDHECQGLKRYL
jgi:hypothetical protein